MASLAGFRAYAVVAADETDEELEICLEGAKEYVRRAGVDEPGEPNRLYDLLVYRLATFYKDNRAFPQSDHDAAYVGINGMILMLRV